ncbi:Zn-ribbon domain-containing OB-fold protein [Haloterrigena sp. H1]|uniref:Zn-ribbon domain-containing OB-fold protein n=1 Tax=Haloterrigena sp. H1 TaxID=2552943 RepID=UPI00110D9A63|nr:Zn-ribbon domain-containing OB-fold protein [Haloterrigena sp. H1]TMT86536.1 Zn-ribbon domain-containing OB-fold protein [Haloterrigena sp. H1]
MTDVTNGEYDAFLEALAEGEGYYLTCENEHGLLPPRRACPHCGDRELTERDLPASGEIVTHTTVFVPTPQFEDDAPYVTAVVDFDGVRLTGIVRGIDQDDVEIGDRVTATVEPNETDGERTIVFHPAD